MDKQDFVKTKEHKDKATPARGNTKQLLMHWLELGALSDENEKLKELLYDEVTQLPTLPLLLPEIERMLKEHRQIGLLYVDVVKESDIERIYGWKVFDQIMEYVSEILQQLKGKCFRQEDRILTLVKNGNSFALLLSPSREKQTLLIEDLAKLRRRIEDELQAALEQTMPSLCKRFNCHIGLTIIEEEPNMRTERVIFNALEKAEENAGLRELAEKTKQIEELRAIIHQENISTLFQPILEIESNRIIGYECFCRGPSGKLENPQTLFNLAIEGDLVWQLDRLCRKKAFQSTKNLKSNQLLFVNINPRSVGDPELRKTAESLLLLPHQLTPDRIVFEISERSMIADMDLFRLVLDYFKALTFLISIDDAGSGYYTGLEIIAKLKPDFVKIDIPLVRDINQDPIRQEIITTIVRFTSKVGARTAAEGIETVDELKTIRELGVDYAQGHLFSPLLTSIPS